MQGKVLPGVWGCPSVSSIIWAMKVSELGEFGLIDLLAKIAPQGGPEHRMLVGIGDDAAAWRGDDSSGAGHHRRHGRRRAFRHGHPVVGAGVEGPGGEPQRHRGHGRRSRTRSGEPVASRRHRGGGCGPALSRHGGAGEPAQGRHRRREHHRRAGDHDRHHRHRAGVSKRGFCAGRRQCRATASRSRDTWVLRQPASRC